jgi:hypothetical protein
MTTIAIKLTALYLIILNVLIHIPTDTNVVPPAGAKALLSLSWQAQTAIFAKQ